MDIMLSVVRFLWRVNKRFSKSCKSIMQFNNYNKAIIDLILLQLETFRKLL
jgi:hypothetical protein